jgi:hypothetical protein
MAKRVWPMQPTYSNINISRKRRSNMARRLGSVCADTDWGERIRTIKFLLNKYLEQSFLFSNIFIIRVMAENILD